MNLPNFCGAAQRIFSFLCGVFIMKTAAHSVTRSRLPASRVAQAPDEHRARGVATMESSPDSPSY